MRTGGREDGVSETYSERLDHTCVCVCVWEAFILDTLSVLPVYVRSWRMKCYPCLIRAHTLLK